ncbi:probable serine hydrolase [Armigeres subalbatus]|uniref:probable serine hydrolase n=1 Tax=Armigeres subalbatus TaxID=124917 RepID=UPI002ED54AC0
MTKIKSLLPQINYLGQMLRAPQQSAGTIVSQRCSHNQQICDETLSIEKPKVEEIRIPVPYGEIAGKWWGPKDTRPIVSLHGWQDNAGTFDRLIPRLPHHMSFLALDFAGHGLSSRIPDGMTYHTQDNIYMLKMVMQHYQWKKISLMGHSMGSIVGFVFSSIFPDMVDLYIGLDALKPHIPDPHEIGPRLQKRIPQMLVADIRNRHKSEPPSYTYEDLVSRLHQGTHKSVSKEAAPYLLNRNIQKSSVNPNKFFFTRDSRLKYGVGIGFSQDINLELAKRLTMPYLFLKAKHSTYYEDKKYFDEFIEVVQKNNPLFELHFVDSTHHMHLTEPKKVAPIVSKFLCKYWKHDAMVAQ